MSQKFTKNRRSRVGRRPSAAEIARAVELCYDDSRLDETIARELGICRRTLARWKHRADFRTALAAHVEGTRRAIDRRLEEERCHKYSQK